MAGRLMHSPHRLTNCGGNLALEGFQVEVIVRVDLLLHGELEAPGVLQVNPFRRQSVVVGDVIAKVHSTGHRRSQVTTVIGSRSSKEPRFKVKLILESLHQRLAATTNRRHAL